MPALALGVDVGSTTVKAVVYDRDAARVVWQDYQRHETQQAEKVLEMLVAIGRSFPDATDLRIFVTGSGAGPLVDPLGARFVQEVNAVALAVSRLHPDVRSVVELGGQDAKIILFHEDERGRRQTTTSMNDKCASGTGATIDKCMIKVGLSAAEVVRIPYDPSRLHHVAAKCGVFAETDIVNLVKSGIPAPEIMNSLANAIVQQNLSVLTRGNTLVPKVLLLGGPNTFLPFLVACWRHRIPETWAQRGHVAEPAPIEDLVFTPKDAQYYAALGAVFFGLEEGLGGDLGRYRGLDGLAAWIRSGRSARLSGQAGRPLVHSIEERDAFVARFTPPPFVPAALAPGVPTRVGIGVDGGSTSSKAVVVDADDDTVLFKAYVLSKGNPIQDTKDLLRLIDDWALGQGAALDVVAVGATGYAADVLQQSLRVDANLVETVAHMASALRFVPDADVVCDIGGQDIKVLFLGDGKHGRDVRDFRLSNQCSAGNGMLLQAMADQFGVALTSYADVAFSAPLAPKFSYGCAVFLDADRVNFQKEGFSAPEMLSGLAQVLPKNVWQYVVQVPRLAEFGRVFVLQGGTQRNLAAVKAQVDYILERVPDARVVVHPHCGEAGAIGAASEALRVVRRRGSSTFVGLQAAMNLRYTSTTDASTVCTFCPNLCTRTFIDTETPDGRTSRYIAGFSCEQGTVESKEALKALTRERTSLRRQFPNLVTEEAELAFKHFVDVAPLPPAGSAKVDVSVSVDRLLRVARRLVRRGFQRSSVDRRSVKIGLPRVLNLYGTAPFFRAYLEALGLPSQNVVFSEPTTEEMFAEGGRYGSIDPCFPAKVVQAHVHELLVHAHPDPKQRRGPLSWIWFPVITHVPTWVTQTMDVASCPIVAGSPNVVKAAFTKEVDFFRRAGVRYVDDAVTFAEPTLLRRQLFETWGARLGVTEDESDFAAEEGWRALAAFDAHLQGRGRAVLEEVEREGRVAILVVGRPYHGDPGLHHGIPDELQVLGYPILSMRSIPKDPAWLARFYPPGSDPLSITDVWPENYSANSVQKVWAVKFAAHHPNVALLDLSSFKCGNDAPTYGIIDKIVATARVPYAALHDIDANKPTGSIKIRVRTYAYKLERVREALQDRLAAQAELERRIAARRRELLAVHRQRSGVGSDERTGA